MTCADGLWWEDNYAEKLLVGEQAGKEVGICRTAWNAVQTFAQMKKLARSSQARKLHL